MLQSMGSQTVRHDWAAEQQHILHPITYIVVVVSGEQQSDSAVCLHVSILPANPTPIQAGT